MASNITLTLGAIMTPAKLDKATETPVTMKNLCVGQNGATHDPTPLHAPKTCEHCGEITDFTAIKKGLPSGGGFVVVEADEVKAIKADTADQFKAKVNLVPVHTEGFDAATSQGDSISYILPAKGGETQYALIAALVEAHPELAFVSLYTPRSRAGLYVVKVNHGVMMLVERVLNENLRPLPQIDGPADPAMVTAMLAPMETFLPTLVTDFDPANYHDNYADAIAKIAAEREVVGIAEVAKSNVTALPTSDTDLLAKLTELAAKAS